MRIYELTVILNPNLDREQANTEIDKLTDMIKSSDGKVFEVQHLGVKRMTFELKGNWQGNYYTVYFNSSPELLPKMEQGMKLNESILRFLNIVLKPSEYAIPGDTKPAPKTEFKTAPEIPDKEPDDYKYEEDEES